MTTGGKKEGKGKVKLPQVVTRGKVSLPKGLQSIASELGTLAIMWGGLESDVAEFLAVMLGKHGETGAAIVGHIELKQRLQIIKHLAFILKPDEVWYEKVLAPINLIDTHLSEERNRMFHDFWTDSVDPEKMTRIKLKPKIDKTNGVQRLVQERKDLHHSDIADLAYRVFMTRLKINTCRFFLKRHLEKQALPEK